MRVAILEDEVPLADHLSTILEQAGHVCHCFYTGKSMLSWLKRETFDIVILDWNLSDISGIDVLLWMREHMQETPPTLFVTSRTDEADIVRALDVGADDYISKPVHPGELLARVGALLRRSYPVRGGGRETFGRYCFESGTAIVRIGDDAVTLTPKEFGLALLLFHNLHRALSRAYMLEKVWGRNPDLPTRTLDAHVSRIRQKLRLRPEHGYRLTPVYSYGYRLEPIEEHQSG